MFDEGQWVTTVSVSEHHLARARSSVWTQCASVTSGPVSPTSSSQRTFRFPVSASTVSISSSFSLAWVWIVTPSWRSTRSRQPRKHASEQVTANRGVTAYRTRPSAAP